MNLHLHPKTFARLAGIGVLAGALALGGSSAALASSEAQDDVAAAVDAVAHANPQAIAQAARSTATEDTIVKARLGRVDVTLPRDATSGVQMKRSDSGAALSLSLPYAEGAARAADTRSGIAAYDNRNSSTTVPVAIDDGTVAIHTVIESESAPTSYSYELTVAPGSTFETWASGEIVILDAAGDFQFAIGAPWAKDANGASVPTHYELNGTTLTQVVEHGSGSAYPIVADPTIGGFYMEWYSWNSAYDRITIQPTFAGYTFNSGLVATYGWQEVINASPLANQPTLGQQFACHSIGNVATIGQTWDLESWRRVITNPLEMFPTLCNW